MSDLTPILNSPYEAPTRYYETDPFDMSFNYAGTREGRRIYLRDLQISPDFAVMSIDGQLEAVIRLNEEAFEASTASLTTPSRPHPAARWRCGSSASLGRRV